MERLLIALVLVAVAVGVAFLLERRRSAAPPTRTERSELPVQADLAASGLSAGPAIVVFTEETCRSCAGALALLKGPAGAGLPVAEVPFGAMREVHRQHSIDTVPTALVVAADGTVVDGWVGQPDMRELALALAEVLPAR